MKIPKLLSLVVMADRAAGGVATLVLCQIRRLRGREVIAAADRTLSASFFFGPKALWHGWFSPAGEIPLVGDFQWRRQKPTSPPL